MTAAQQSPRLRLGVLAIVILALFAALFARLWYLQVASPEDFGAQADANRLRIVQVEAPRGRIFDRNGKVLVDNRVSVVVTVDRVLLNALSDVERSRMLARLAEEVTRYGSPATVADLLDRVNDVRYSRYAPVPVAEDVSEELKLYIDEHAELFPSVRVERVAVRRYTYGTRGAHVLGYVGEINDQELTEREDKPKTYIRGNQIGKTGVERIYEDDLRGVPGTKVFEVDAAGRPVRLIEEASTDPIPGDDIWLTIDIDLQAVVEDELVVALESARARVPRGDNPPNRAPAGSAVVMDPGNGEVIALASYPTYDPAAFINGISSSEWEFLNDKANDTPILNRAIAGQYAPGSTFKLVSGYAAVVNGLMETTEPFVDTGSYTVPECTGQCTFRNAGNRAYGTVDLAEAITVSSDAYFYSIGADFWAARGRLGEEALQETARLFGFGQETGIPLPAEQDGRLPTPEQKKAQYEAAPDLFESGSWFTGDNVITAIGQGDVAVTPLQLANAYATFANGGTRFAPNIASKVTKGGDVETVIREFGPRINSQIEFDPEVEQSLRQGLLGVTSSLNPRGTAVTAFSGFPLDRYPVAGKTGTAEVDSTLPDGTERADSAVFAAYGPVRANGEAPDFQVSIILEESGFGGTAAAPMARTLFDIFAGLTPPPRLQPGGELLAPLDPADDRNANGIPDVDEDAVVTTDEGEAVDG